MPLLSEWMIMPSNHCQSPGRRNSIAAECRAFAESSRNDARNLFRESLITSAADRSGRPLLSDEVVVDVAAEERGVVRIDRHAQFLVEQCLQVASIELRKHAPPDVGEQADDQRNSRCPESSDEPRQSQATHAMIGASGGEQIQRLDDLGEWTSLTHVRDDPAAEGTASREVALEFARRVAALGRVEANGSLLVRERNSRRPGNDQSCPNSNVPALFSCVEVSRAFTNADAGHSKPGVKTFAGSIR